MSYGTCKYCGCTDNNACNHPDHGPCWWIDCSHEICSHCGIPEISKDPATTRNIDLIEGLFGDLSKYLTDEYYCALLLKNRSSFYVRHKACEDGESPVPPAREGYYFDEYMSMFRLSSSGLPF